MKTPFTFILIALFYWNAYATIHTVNNSPDSAADYNNVQAAIDAATAGDTIYVAGSNAPYPNFNVDKELTVFGSGYFSNETGVPSKVTTIFINASNVWIAGFECTNITLPFSSVIDNCVISDNHIKGLLYLRIGSGHLVEGNLFTRNADVSIDAMHAFPASDYIIRNNVIYGRISNIRNSGAIVNNNVFVNSGSSAASINSNSGSFTNNIYFGHQSAGCPACTHQFELLYYYDSGTSAYVGSNPMFVNPATLPTNNTVSYDPNYDWSLQAGSPAIGVGQFGYDLGAYGGLTPFVPGGYPPIPRITSLTSPSSQIEEGGTVQITIQAVSQQ